MVEDVSVGFNRRSLLMSNVKLAQRSVQHASTTVAVKIQKMINMAVIMWI